FDEHTVRITVDERGKPELPGQHDGSGLAVIEEDGGAIAAVVCLAFLRCGFAGRVGNGEAVLIQLVAVLREQLLFRYPRRRHVSVSVEGVSVDAASVFGLELV